MYTTFYAKDIRFFYLSLQPGFLNLVASLINNIKIIDGEVRLEVNSSYKRGEGKGKGGLI